MTQIIYVMCQSLFPAKNIINLLSAEFVKRVVMVKQ